jgi:hypothetical protein
MKYWAMRTDRQNRELILDELRQGRLRQGWGWAPEQDLRVIWKKVETDEDLTKYETSAWKNWAMLGGDEGMEVDSLIILPNLPERSMFLIAEVTGDYYYEPLTLDKTTDVNDLGQDYGHVMPVSLPAGISAFRYQDDRIAAPVRRSLRCQSRIWSVQPYERQINELLEIAKRGEADKGSWDLGGTLDRVYRKAKEATRQPFHEALEKGFDNAFGGEELEEPCRILLDQVFPKADVRRIGGSHEHGADILVTWDDPLSEYGTRPSLSWRMVVQVKNWRGVASDIHPIDQICAACRYYGKDYPVRGALIMTFCNEEDEEFSKYRKKVSEDIGISIEFLTREQILDLFFDIAPIE